MNTYITLNITLAELQLKYVEDYLQKALGEPRFIGVSACETGRTLVVQYKHTEFVLERLSRVARDLKVACIAYRIQDGGVVYKGVAGDYVHAYAYSYDDFVVASTNLLGCSGVPLEPTQVQTYTKASDVEQAYDVAAAEGCGSEGCYALAVAAAHELGGVETHNSNTAASTISFAPTRVFAFDDASRVEVTYGGATVVC